MNAETQDRKHTIRNIIIFIVAINILGWLGWMIAKGGGNTEAQGLGMIIWLVGPLLARKHVKTCWQPMRLMGFRASRAIHGSAHRLAGGRARPTSRIHSSLGYLTPAELESQWLAQQDVMELCS